MPVQVIESIADLYCPREMKKATQNQYELCNAIDLKKKKKSKEKKKKNKQRYVCFGMISGNVQLESLGM